MIVAYHIIFSTYGFWLPNDPRGMDPEDLPRAIRYVEDNPIKEGKKKQEWSFVTPVG